MSADGNLLWAEVDRIVDERIAAALARYKPDLAQATGTLSPTRYPTPTGNAPGGYTPATHTHPWSDITATPTTLAGYGIVDAAPLIHTHAAGDITSGTMATARLGSGTANSTTFLRGDSTWATISGTGTVTSVDITAPAAGITATGGPITTSGSITLALANDLAALEGLSSTGLAARTATDTWAQRTITGTTNRIAVTNGGGVAGDPTINIDTGYVGQASITTLGTVGAGTWQGTKIGLAYGGTNADLSATGGAGQYLKQASAGAAVTVGAIPASDLAYSGLTTGQVLRATGTTTAAFGALDLANSSAVTGVLPAANGGTGVNNSTRTLTIATNGGTLAFSAASSTLTIPATGTAALLGTAQTFSEDNAFSKLLRTQVTSGTTGYGIRFSDGTDDWAVFQGLNTAGTSFLFFGTNRYFDGTSWQQLNTRVGGFLQITGDALFFNSFATSSSTPVQALSVTGAGVATHTLSDAGTNATADLLILRHNTSGTAAAGFGSTIQTQLESSTTADQDAADEITTWATATHASRKARRTRHIFDTAARETIREEASGTAPMIGFLGAAAVVRQSVAAAAPAGGTGTAAGGYDTAAHRDALITLVNDIRTAGVNLGLWS